jgi:hypothetical protein
VHCALCGGEALAGLGLGLEDAFEEIGGKLPDLFDAEVVEDEGRPAQVAGRVVEDPRLHGIGGEELPQDAPRNLPLQRGRQVVPSIRRQQGPAHAPVEVLDRAATRALPLERDQTVVAQHLDVVADGADVFAGLLGDLLGAGNPLGEDREDADPLRLRQDLQQLMVDEVLGRSSPALASSLATLAPTCHFSVSSQSFLGTTR